MVRLADGQVGAARFSLDDAAELVGEMFDQMQRCDLTDVMSCTDPDDAIAALLSMPPGDAAPEEEQARLARLIRDEADRAGGVLRVTRRNGLVSGVKLT